MAIAVNGALAALPIGAPARPPVVEPAAAAPIASVVSPATAPAAPRRGPWVLLAVGLAALVAAGGAVVYLRSRPAAPSFRTVQVVRTDVTQRVTATGTLQPVITSPVGAQVSGIVWKLHADYNSEVKAGQLLVELDPALFQNAVALATAQIAQARASLTSARATALGARAVRDRTRSLQHEALVSDADLDASEAVFGQATGLTQSGAAQISQAVAQLARARLDLQHSIIRSPVDGTVISRNVDVGQAVAATLTAPTLFTIAQDLHHMQVHAAVDEADIGELRPAQSATFTVDAFRGRKFGAVVREVRNAPQTAQNVVTYDVVLDVDNLDGVLRPGMTANVLILIVQRPQVVAVPNEALRFRPAAVAGRVAAAKPAATDAQASVYVAEGPAAVRVPVTLGVTDGTMTEVSGLEPGREVIVDVMRAKGKAAPTAGGASRGP